MSGGPFGISVDVPPTTTVHAPPTTVVVAPPAAPVPFKGPLPFTGADVALLMALATLAIVVGALIVAFGRRMARHAAVAVVPPGPGRSLQGR